MEPISLPRETVQRPNSSRAIILVAPNDIAKEQFEITGPRIKEYAYKCGADLIVLEDDHFPDWPMANKWRIVEHAQQYDRVLYLDVDIVINPYAPDIFKFFNGNLWWVYDESHDIPDLARSTYWINHTEVCVSQGVPVPRWCCNGGVLLFSGSQAHLYQPPKKPWDKIWCFDQSILSSTLNQNEFGFMSASWNWGFIRKDWWEGVHAAFFIHVNGSRPQKYRLELLHRLVNNNFEQYPPQCSFRLDEDNTCKAATKLALIRAFCEASDCVDCKKHKHYVNPVTCRIAKKTQIEAGLEPDPSLDYPE